MNPRARLDGAARRFRLTRGAFVTLVALASIAGCKPGPPVIMLPRARETVLTGNTIDARARFREIFCAIAIRRQPDRAGHPTCDDEVVRLPDELPGTGRAVAQGGTSRRLRLMIVPGLLGDCLKSVTTFGDALADLERLGYRPTVARVSGLGSAEHNARQLAGQIRTLRIEPGERLVLVGHSKGAVDILRMLVDFPETVSAMAGVITVAGPIRGSPLGESLPLLYRMLIGIAPLSRCDAGDGRGVESLRPAEQRDFLARHALPTAVSYVSVGGIPGPARVSRLLRAGYRRLSAIDPSNDGQVIWSDTVVPGGVLAGFVRADHWAIAAPLSSGLLRLVGDRNEFPRALLLEALVRLLEERLDNVQVSPMS